MSLFDCAKCGHVENTAMAPWYGMDKIQECSLCHTGEWHGMFRRYIRSSKNADSSKAKQTMTTHIKTKAGETFALNFTEGMPPSLSGPNVYLLRDGSIAMGAFETDDLNKKWLKTFNPAGMTPMEIPAEQIIGWASAAPRRGVFG